MTKKKKKYVPVNNYHRISDVWNLIKMDMGKKEKCK